MGMIHSCMQLYFGAKVETLKCTTFLGGLCGPENWETGLIVVYVKDYEYKAPAKCDMMIS